MVIVFSLVSKSRGQVLENGARRAEYGRLLWLGSNNGGTATSRGFEP